MSEVLQAIGNAMRSEAEVLRVITQNVVNEGTIAYKRQVAIPRVEFNALLQQSSGGAGATLPSAQLEVTSDFSTGTLKSTGQSLDVALDGMGFFVVDTVQGAKLTRRGDLRISAEGVITSAQGDPIEGERGAIQLAPNSKCVISPDGTVSADGVVLDRLRIVIPTDTKQLIANGEGLFQLDAQYWLEGDSRPSVRQGFLEASNVTPVNEMVQMMETLRRFESEQKFVRAYDEMVGHAISELGKIG